MGIICLLIFTQTYSVLTEYCALGPRVPGSLAHRRAKDYIIEYLSEAEVDSFDHQGITFFNIVSRFNKESKRKIAFATHWESRPTADRERTPKNRQKPILGANDGGSGVAVLLVLADSLKKRPPGIGVDLIFFDGEDFGKEPSLLGSEYFARKCDQTYEYVIVIDMIGDKDLTLYKEGYSYKFFPTLVDSIWQIGKRINSRVFRDEIRHYVIDDHMCLIKSGFVAIDIIDFDYPYWHTLEDKIDKCSEKSLNLILTLLLKLTYEQY